MITFSKLLLAAVFLTSASSATAEVPDQAEAAARNLVETELRPMLQQPEVIAAIKNHNETYPLAPSNDEVVKLEQIWHLEATGDHGGLVEQVNASAASEILREMIDDFRGKYTEFLVMGKHGLLVAQSAVATDYFQGDEDKYKKSFPLGPDAVYVDKLGYDQSVAAVQAQVSFTLIDPETGEPVGAATVGIRRGVLPGM